MKTKSLYKCQECGFESPKWLGKCPDCDSWNSFKEISIKNTLDVEVKNLVTTQNLSPIKSIAEVIEESKTQKQSRYLFSTSLLNDFWNQGLVEGSLTLLAGEPGQGKSTLALQLLRSLIVANKGLKTMYVTAEESLYEVARRSQRLEIPDNILLLQNNDFNYIQEQILLNRPQVAIIDSIQTIFSPNLPGSPGSVSQVTLIANQFLSLSKTYGVAVILIGHVTKEGQIAGPKTLEHLVDSVLYLDASEASGYRTLGFSKHRYGSVDNELLMKMEENGLQIVKNPSLAMLENLETGVGVCYGIAVEKNLPLVVEIQALVSKPFSSGGFGRREALGLKVSKLNTILAVAEKYLNLDLKSSEIYVQISGLPKPVADDSLDLAILLAIVSSIREKSIEIILNLTDTKAVFAGRLTLSGDIRKATKDDIRQKTAKKLGFDYNSTIKLGKIAGLFG